MRASLGKPVELFDRDWEWAALRRFVADPRPGMTLGIVSGRRRQGKSMLLAAMARAAGGFYYETIDGGEAEILRDLGAKLATHLAAPAPLALASSEGALNALAGLGSGGDPLPVVVDELPAWAAASPALPSLVRNLLGPGGARRRSHCRLLLCGSAVGFMGRLLGAQAPLRGRAGLELVVSSFDYRTARAFWGLRDRALAARVFAVVGGTPAYAREFVAGDTPRAASDFDAWLLRAVLNPAVPLFREGRILLAEDPALGDRALYHSILAAIASGETTSARIAGRLGRPATSLGHPLSVLADTGFVRREADAFHSKKVHYLIEEPMLAFHHAILRPAWSELERPGRAAEVWRRSRARFEAGVLGPAFEAMCRTWATRFAAEDTFGGPLRAVQRGLVPDAASGRTHEIDVVVMGERDSILALGEAKWGRVEPPDVARLHHVRELLGSRGYDTSSTRLAFFSAAPFPRNVSDRARADGTVLVDLERLYEGE